MRHKLQLFAVIALSFTGNLLALAGPKLSGSAISLISKGAETGIMDMPRIYR